MHNSFVNAHHAPIGAFAAFTPGFPGASGGLGLELGLSMHIGSKYYPRGVTALLRLEEV